MNFEFSMRGSGHCMFLARHFVETFLLSPQQREDFFVSRPARCLPYECCPLVSVPSSPILASYSFIILENRVRASSVDHLAITEQCVLSVMLYLIVARDGTVCYQRSDSRPLHLFLWSSCSITGAIADSGSRLPLPPYHRRLCILYCVCLGSVSALS